jgi:hypothetical protein
VEVTAVKRKTPERSPSGFAHQNIGATKVTLAFEINDHGRPHLVSVLHCPDAGRSATIAFGLNG